MLARRNFLTRVGQAENWNTSFFFLQYLRSTSEDLSIVILWLKIREYGAAKLQVQLTTD